MDLRCKPYCSTFENLKTWVFTYNLQDVLLSTIFFFFSSLTDGFINLKLVNIDF